MLRVLVLVLVLSFSLLLAGCAGTSGGLGGPETATLYLLDANIEPRVNTPAKAAELPVLLIAAPRIDAAFDTTGIAYRRDPLQLSYYRDSRWADTPARMLEPPLARALEHSGGFRAVLVQPTLADADLTLNVHVIQLVQEFFSSPSQVRLELRADLIDNADSRVLATRRFTLLEMAPSDDADGGARAANAVLAQALSQLAEFVTAASGV